MVIICIILKEHWIKSLKICLRSTVHSMTEFEQFSDYISLSLIIYKIRGEETNSCRLPFMYRSYSRYFTYVDSFNSHNTSN